MIRYTTTPSFQPNVQSPPARATEHSAGIDLSTPVELTIATGESLWVDTGIAVQIPTGCVGLIRSRSGLRARHRISVFGGVIDSDYTGALMVEVCRDWYEAPSIILPAGSRIAQIVIVPCVMAAPVRVSKLDETERGGHGFGSTGA